MQAYLSENGMHRSLLNLSLSRVRSCIPNCQLAGSGPVKPFADS